MSLDKTIVFDNNDNAQSYPGGSWCQRRGAWAFLMGFMRKNVQLWGMKTELWELKLKLC